MNVIEGIGERRETDEIESVIAEAESGVRKRHEAKRIAEDLTRNFGLSVVGIYLVGSDSRNDPINLACVCSNCSAEDFFGVPYHLRQYIEAEKSKERIRGYDIKFSFYREGEKLPDKSIPLTGEENQYSDVSMKF